MLIKKFQQTESPNYKGENDLAWIRKPDRVYVGIARKSIAFDRNNLIYNQG